MGTARIDAERKPVLAFAYDPALARGVYSPAAIERLSLVCEVIDTEPLQRFDDARAHGMLPRIDILATSWGCPHIDVAAVAAMPRLRLVAHGAGTVKSFVSGAAYDAGITVTNAAAANAIPVAEYTLACIIMANKRMLFFRDLYRGSRTGLQRHPAMQSDLGNQGKTIGLIGASRIGRRVIALLRPFEFRVLLHDPFMDAEEATALGVELAGIDELMSSSDVVSLHAPALDNTRGLIDARRLALLRDGATFINTARGSLVQQDALVRELVSGRIGAILDVTEPEVLPSSSPLYELPNVFLTPHIAGAVGGERQRLGDLAVDEIVRFLSDEPLQHAIAPVMLDSIA